METQRQGTQSKKTDNEISQIAEALPEMSEAKAMLVAGQASQAMFQLEKGVGRYPNHCDLWHAYGHTLRDQGNHDEALQAYSRAIDLALRYHPLIHFECSAQFLQRAILHLQMRETDKAAADLDAAIFQDHGNEGAMHLKAHGWNPDNPPPKYEKNLMTETAWHNETSRVQSDFAHLQNYQQQHDKAIYFFRHNIMRTAFVIMNELLKSSPHYAMAWHHRALMFLHIGETRPAYDDLNHAINHAEKWHENYHHSAALHHLHRGKLYAQLDQPEMALTDYDKALQLDKNFISIHVEQACLRAQLGQLPTAIANIEQALEAEARPEWQQMRSEWVRQMGG